MPRHRTPPGNRPNLHKMIPDERAIEIVDEWLETSGFPLEAKVARALAAAGGRIHQSRYYVDPAEPGTLRELDVLAVYERFGSFFPRTGYIEIRLVVECK